MMRHRICMVPFMTCFLTVLQLKVYRKSEELMANPFQSFPMRDITVLLDISSLKDLLLAYILRLTFS